MRTLNQKRRLEFKIRKDTLIRTLDQTKPQAVVTFLGQYRDLILEYADVIPSTYVKWANEIRLPTLKLHKGPR